MLLHPCRERASPGMRVERRGHGIKELRGVYLRRAAPCRARPHACSARPSFRAPLNPPSPPRRRHRKPATGGNRALNRRRGSTLLAVVRGTGAGGAGRRDEAMACGPSWAPTREPARDWRVPGQALVAGWGSSAEVDVVERDGDACAGVTRIRKRDGGSALTTARTRSGGRQPTHRWWPLY